MLELTVLFSFCPNSCNALIALTAEEGGRGALNGSLEPPRTKLFAALSSSENHQHQLRSTHFRNREM